MCTKMGNKYANLFIGFIQELVCKQFPALNPNVFGRYINDCFGVTSCSKPDLESFISYYV